MYIECQNFSVRTERQRDKAAKLTWLVRTKNRKKKVSKSLDRVMIRGDRNSIRGALGTTIVATRRLFITRFGHRKLFFHWHTVTSFPVNIHFHLS